MILDSSLIFQMTSGDAKRIPESGDTQLTVPATVLPIVLALRPLTAIAVGAQIDDSAFISVVQSRSNVAALDQIIMTLNPGVWEIELQLAVNSNVPASLGTSIRTSIDYLYQGVTNPALSVMSGPFLNSLFGRNRVLLTSPLSIVFHIVAVAVAQNIDSIASVNAIRII